jgi:cysteine sulfinate desulfinase/cysteine desulfurase-like protein
MSLTLMASRKGDCHTNIQMLSLNSWMVRLDSYGHISISTGMACKSGHLSDARYIGKLLAHLSSPSAM